MQWRLFSAVILVVATVPCYANNWRAQVISKFQIDNRETHAAQAFLEIWGSFEFESLEHDYRISAHGAARKGDLLAGHLDHNS